LQYLLAGEPVVNFYVCSKCDPDHVPVIIQKVTNFPLLQEFLEIISGRFLSDSNFFQNPNRTELSGFEFICTKKFVLKT